MAKASGNNVAASSQVTAMLGGAPNSPPAKAEAAEAAAAEAADKTAAAATAAAGKEGVHAAQAGADEAGDKADKGKGKSKGKKASNESLLQRLDELVGEAEDGEGEGEVGPGARYKAVMALVAQLEARIRDLESIAYVVANMKDTHTGASKAVLTANKYRKAVRKAPKTHGLGSATAMVTNAFMVGTVEHGVTDAVDLVVYQRYLGIILLTAIIKQLEPGQTELFVRHFFAVEAYKEGMVKVVYMVEGSMALPEKPEEVTEIETAIEAAKAASSDAPLLPLAEKYFLIIDGEPTAAHGRRAYKIGKLLRTLLCATGATCPSSKAPPGPLVRTVRGRRGGKKSKAAKGDEGDDDEDD